MERFHQVYEAAGLTIVKQVNQQNFSKEIFCVTIYKYRSLTKEHPPLILTQFRGNEQTILFYIHVYA